MAENNVAPMTTSCWKKSYDESGSFFDNLKNSFNVFVDTPMREHKDCFKFTWHKVINYLVSFIVFQ